MNPGLSFPSRAHFVCSQKRGFVVESDPDLRLLSHLDLSHKKKKKKKKKKKRKIPFSKILHSGISAKHGYKYVRKIRSIYLRGQKGGFIGHCFYFLFYFLLVFLDNERQGEGKREKES